MALKQDDMHFVLCTKHCRKITWLQWFTNKKVRTVMAQQHKWGFAWLSKVLLVHKRQRNNSIQDTTKKTGSHLFLLFRKVILPFHVLNTPLKKMGFWSAECHIFHWFSYGWMANSCKIMSSFKYEISGFLWTGCYLSTETKFSDF